MVCFASQDTNIFEGASLMAFKLRDYQERCAGEAVGILKENGLACAMMEVRTGKTHTALTAAQRYGAKNVAFLTKLKAVPSVQKDFEVGGYSFNLGVINDESLHKLNGDFDFLIYDESHRHGSFPKPGISARAIRERFKGIPQLRLSGTFAPENWSQLYHQFWSSSASPFKQRTFYKWADAYVSKKEIYTGGPRNSIDYSHARIHEFAHLIEPYFFRCTQAEAGFKTKIRDHFVTIQMSDSIGTIINILEKNRIVQGAEHCITADTPASLRQKIQQLSGGTIIFDSPEKGNKDSKVKGVSKVLCTKKVEYMKNRWIDSGGKIAIFYVFKAELEAIQQVLGDKVTTSIAEFDGSDKSIALQIQSGREGTNLSKADAIVMYNSGDASLNIAQGRDRATILERENVDVFWLFSDCGNDREVYQNALAKQRFIEESFKPYFGTREFSPRQLELAA